MPVLSVIAAFIVSQIVRSIDRTLDFQLMRFSPEGVRGLAEAINWRDALVYCFRLFRVAPDSANCERGIVSHGSYVLGYLYSPAESPLDANQDIEMWVYEAWEWLVRRGCGLLPNRPPSWFKHPQMMRMAVTSYGLLKRMHRLKRLRPFDRFLVPVLANGGQPANVDPEHYTLVTPFEPDQSKWMDAVCFNIDDPHDTREYQLGTTFDSPQA